LADIILNLGKLAAIGLLLPSSTADYERGFPTFKRGKTKLRYRLCNKSLQSLLRISMEGPRTFDFNYNKVVELWNQKKSLAL
jgi:hypothetical protein